MSDGRQYGQVTPTRKIFYHPRAPHVGFVLGNNLRNIYCTEQNRGRMIVQKSWVRNLERPWLPSGFFHSDGNIDADDYRTFFVWHAALRDAPNSDSAIQRDRTWINVCFTILSERAQTAFVALQSEDDSNGLLRATVQVPLGADAAARIAEGALTPFESRGGSYEATVSLVSSSAGSALRLYTCQAYAASVDEDGNRIGEALRIDAVDLWTEKF